MSSAAIAGDSSAAVALVSPPPPWWDVLCGVAYESHRVVAGHSRHFLFLTVLYLLPLSSSLIVLPSLLSDFPPNSNPSGLLPPQSLLQSHHHRLFPWHVSASAILLPLLCSVTALCAAAAIPGSTQHGFFGRPVKLIHVQKSIPESFPRLISTVATVAVVAAAALTLIFSLLLLSLRIFYLHQFATYVFFAAIALALILYLSTKWSLAIVISAVEPAWCFHPLRLSAELTSGMCWASFFLNFFFNFSIGIVLWGFSLWPDGISDDIVPRVARTVFGSAATAILMLYWLVSATVLYVYCKALHGGLDGEIAEEFGREYDRLPFDEEKIPHIISILRQ